MGLVQPVVSDMLVTVKSREVQRAMLAEKGDRAEEAKQHLLAAGHLELVLANDYEQSGDDALARRSRISAASCFWRAGERDRAQTIFDSLANAEPQQASEIQQVISDLQQARSAS